MCIGRAMDLIALVVEVVAGGSLIVFVVCCWVACPVVGRVDFRTMIVLAVVEVVLRSMIVEVYLAYSAGSWAGSRVARWHTACCRILPYSAHLIQRHHRLEEVSSPGVRLVLGQVVLRDYMPLVQVDVTAAVAAVLYCCCCCYWAEIAIEGRRNWCLGLQRRCWWRRRRKKDR